MRGRGAAAGLRCCCGGGAAREEGAPCSMRPSKARWRPATGHEACASRTPPTSAPVSGEACAVTSVGAPPSLSGDKLEAWLDHRAAGPGDPQPLTTRLRAVENAQGKEELHRHARALAQWIEGQT